jgi:hypothetical protein
MSKAWMIQGFVKEKPRIGKLKEYNGEDVFSPYQPKHGQIDEMLMNLSHSDRVIIIGINPDDSDTIEEIAQEFKDTAIFGLNASQQIAKHNHGNKREVNRIETPQARRIANNLR